jgi:hypothetical protein
MLLQVINDAIATLTGSKVRGMIFENSWWHK